MTNTLDFMMLVIYLKSLLSNPSGTDLTEVFHLHHHHPVVGRSSKNSHVQAISALLPAYHTSLEIGQRQGSGIYQRRTQRQIQRQRQNIQEESLPKGSRRLKKTRIL